MVLEVNVGELMGIISTSNTFNHLKLTEIIGRINAI